MLCLSHCRRLTSTRLLVVYRTGPLKLDHLKSALLDLDTKTKVSMDVQAIKEISCVPTGTNAEGGYLAASSIIYNIRAKYGDEAAIQCLHVFTMCNAHDKPIEFYLSRLSDDGDTTAQNFLRSCNGNWQGGLGSSRMLNTDLTPMDVSTQKLYKKERTQPMGDLLLKSVECETTVAIMKKAALETGLTMEERMGLLIGGLCVGIPKNGYLRAKRFLVMATIAQLNPELCIDEIPMQCQPDLGSFKCIKHFCGTVSTDRANQILQSVAINLRWSLVKTENALCELWRRTNTRSRIPMDFYFPGQQFVEYLPPISLVIEVTDGLTTQECNDFAKKFKGKTATPLDATVAHKVVSVLVLPMPQSGIQYYDAEKLHVRPHYMTTDSISSLKQLYGDRPLTMIDPLTLSAEDINFDLWDALKNLVEAEGKVNVRGNIVLTKGFSTQAMRTSRENGGVPPVTYGGMSDTVATMVTPLLTYLTSQVLNKGYSLRGGDMFSQKLLLGNYYEAVAVAVTRGPDVKPHMDRKNDWREGHDIMGALTYTGCDAKGYYRVGVFGYTRKDVGDHLRWMATQ
jgi:hypothetical protein